MIQNMHKRIAVLLVMALMLTVCSVQKPVLADKEPDYLEAEYTGEIYVGERVSKSDFEVTLYYDDGSSRLLRSGQFDVRLSGSDSMILESQTDTAIITYQKLWTSCEITSKAGDAGEEYTKLLSISAEYDGKGAAVGGQISRSDITVKGYYEVYYDNGTVGKTTKIVSGWTLDNYTIGKGSNSLRIRYEEDGIEKTCTVTVNSLGTDGNWVKEDTVWRYLYDDGTYLMGDWVRTNGRWYYLDQNGYLVTKTTYTVDEKTYYLDESGMMLTGWVYLNSNWFYFDGSGAMQTGWVYAGNNWYYMDKQGRMVTGWFYDEDKDKWYYLNEQGKMHVGWLFRTTWFYLDSDGSMRTGWVKTNGKWYYMDNGGAMLTNTWVGNYYVDGSGAWTQTR